MKLQELLEALKPYNPEAEIIVGLSVPDLFINVRANLSVTCNADDAADCTEVRLITTALPRPMPPGISQAKAVHGDSDE